MRATGCLAARFKGSRRFTTSDDNRRGEDLWEETPAADVEIKSGRRRTDARVGLRTLGWALSREAAANSLSEILAESMWDRRRSFLAGDLPGIERSKLATASRLRVWLDDARSSVERDAGAMRRFSHFVLCLAQGITNLPGMRRTKEGPAPRILLIECDWEKGFRPYSIRAVPHERFRLDVFGPSSEARVTLRARGESNATRRRIYAHYRNSFHCTLG